MLSDPFDWIAGQTIANEQRDFVEWHQGRAPYVLWALDLDFPEVRQRQAAAAQHMAAWLLPDYCRQAHVTLDLCGFPSSVPGLPDEFSATALMAQEAALKKLALSPFDIQIGALKSFASAPYLAVRDEAGTLEFLHATLARAGGRAVNPDFVPHLTVGLYAGAWSGRDVLQGLHAFAKEKPLACRIERISLLAYQPSIVGGPLHCLANFGLDRQKLVWVNQADQETTLFLP